MAWSKITDRSGLAVTDGRPNRSVRDGGHFVVGQRLRAGGRPCLVDVTGWILKGDRCHGCHVVGRHERRLPRPAGTIRQSRSRMSYGGSSARFSMKNDGRTNVQVQATVAQPRLDLGVGARLCCSRRHGDSSTMCLTPARLAASSAGTMSRAMLLRAGGRIRRDHFDAVEDRPGLWIGEVEARRPRRRGKCRDCGGIEIHCPNRSARQPTVDRSLPDRCCRGFR